MEFNAPISIRDMTWAQLKQASILRRSMQSRVRSEADRGAYFTALDLYDSLDWAQWEEAADFQETVDPVRRVGSIFFATPDVAAQLAEDEEL